MTKDVHSIEYTSCNITSIKRSIGLQSNSAPRNQPLTGVGGTKLNFAKSAV